LGVIAVHFANQQFQQYVDGDTMETCICHPDASGEIVQSTSWEGDPSITWDQLGLKLQAYVGAGKPVLVISDLGSSKGGREDAFPCYASARLAGLIWYGLFSPSQITALDACTGRAIWRYKRTLPPANPIPFATNLSHLNKDLSRQPNFWQATRSFVTKPVKTAKTIRLLSSADRKKISRRICFYGKPSNESSRIHGRQRWRYGSQCGG
jgi:hypothetical protein